MINNVIMAILDVFDITGKGTVVIGTIIKSCTIDEKVYLLRPDDTLLETCIIGIDYFEKKLKSADNGDNVGIWLENVTKKDIPDKTIIIKSPLVLE